MLIKINQLPSTIGKKEENIKKLLDSLDVKNKKDNLIHIFPELFTTGYLVDEKLNDMAETIPGPTTDLISKKLKNREFVIFGLPEKDKTKLHIFNTAVMIGRNGLIGKYQKIFLPNFWIFKEKKYFSTGKKPILIDLGGLKLGLQICYDINFPEISRYQALNLAKIIFIISATPIESIPRFITLLKARAIENQLYVVYVNKVGLENDIKFGGNSMIIRPNGEIEVNLDDKIESKLFEINLKMVDEVRKKIPLLNDAKKLKFEWS